MRSWIVSARPAMLGSLPSRSSSSSRIASGPSGASGSWLVVGLLHPVGVVLGTEVQQQQTRCARRSRRPTPRARPRCRRRSSGGPRSSVTVGDSRLPLCTQPPQHAEELALPRLGIHARRGPLGIGHAEELEEQRQHLAEAPRRSAAAVPRSSRAPRDRRPARRCRSRPGRPGAWAGAGCSCRGRRRGLRSTRRPRARQRSSELEAEAALADAGLADHADHLAVALAACASAASSACMSSSRPTKRVSPRARDTSKRVRSAPDPSSSKTRTGSLHALHLERPEVLELEVARDQRGRVLASGRRVSGSASCSMRAARPTVCPCAV